MRLDITVKQEHAEITTAVSWSPDCQLLSCSDDKIVGKWGADGESIGKITTLNVFISSLSWFPVSGKQSPDMFAISCTDGTFRFVSRSGREEKKIAAHEGAVIVVRWSHDGSALLTAGEDGDVKIWSKSGNLRSCLVSTGQSVYCACWGPDDDQVLIASGKTLMIKTVQASRKNLQWNAHDGIVLCVDWNVSNGNIVSGGEDCMYKVWDSFGRQLYSSRGMEHVITSVGWSPNGECFAVGSHNTLRLCDKTGWTHCRERVQSGSILDIAWTSDGTQFAGAGGNGSVVFALVVDRHFEWKNALVTLLEPRRIRVQDVATETLQDLSFARDRVVEIGLGFEWLVVTTTTQCFIYSLSNLNTPTIFEIKAPPHFLHLCKKSFLTLDQISGLQIISYEGRVICTPRFQGLRAEYLTKDLVAMSPDTVVVVDSVDTKHVHILDSSSGKEISKLTHTIEVTCVCLNQHMLGFQDRLLAFCDRNKDLYLALLSGMAGSGGGAAQMITPTYKLHSQVDSFSFNDETDVLVGLADGRLNVWYQPLVAFTDKDLVPLTTSSAEAKDSSAHNSSFLQNFLVKYAEFGRNAQIISFTGNRVSIRKVDGAILFAATSSDISLLYELTRSGRWDESLRLCRHQKSPSLWVSLASAALSRKQLDTAEIALAEINEVTKVEYIQHIKSIPSEEGRLAGMALFRRQPEEAERILLQSSPPLVHRAIKLNLSLFRWGRALDLAVKYRSHVDTVLGYRQKHLEEFGKVEKNAKFLQYAGQVSIDWEAIIAKEQKELEDETDAAKNGGRGARK